MGVKKIIDKMIYNSVPKSEFTRRIGDGITEEFIDEIANNGDTQKKLLARIYLSNNKAHDEIHNKLVEVIKDTKTNTDAVSELKGFNRRLVWGFIVLIGLSLLGIGLTYMVQSILGG